MSLLSLPAAVGAGDVLIGLSLGSRLFLIAVGLSLIFGILDVLNFAHGALFMLGAYGTMSVATMVVDNFWIAVVLGSLAVGVVGALIELGILRRLYGRSEADLDQLIVTFGLVLVITELTRVIWGTGTYALDPPAVLAGSIEIAGTTMTTFRLFVIGMSVVVMAGLWFLIQQTHYGRLIRATASDREMAAMLGVDVPRLYTAVFFLGSLLAGLGGALAIPLESIDPSLGEQVIIEAFIVVVIGGLGSLSGAFVGAMTIGVLQSIGVSFLSAGSMIIPFAVMILVLIVRPEGLFGGLNT